MPEQPDVNVPFISTPFISVKALSRYYGPIHAVRNISFDVKRGEVLGFLGPNGAGKSTTMQMLAGNLAPTSGQILINGIDLLDQPRRAKADIGYLPEQPPLYKELTVNEYLAYAARINRIARPQQREAIDSAKQRCGLTEVGRRLIGNLSKGYQQRVGIAQAIIHSPAIVILDEPTVGLDPIQIREIRHLIRELGDNHGVILSTHILPEVQATCDRVQIIHNGELVLSDSLAHLNEEMQADSLIVAFANPPSLNELEAINAVQSAEALDDQRFRLQFDAAHNPAPTIAQQAVSNGWQLLELTPQRHTLEEIFVQITSGEYQHTQKTEEEHAA
jgi:ABC-2 type transport system ATP-binding protein